MADKIVNENIDLFFGGMAEDIRLQKLEHFFLTQHLDIWTNPKRLVPYRAMEADENTAYSIVLMFYAQGNLFGLGIVAASAKVQVYKKDTDPITGAWTTVANGADSGGARSTNCFIEFHAYAYGGSAGTRLWAADLTGVAAFTSTAYNGAGAPLCQGIVTSDDKLIIPCASGIALKDGAGSGPTTNWSVYNIVPASHTVVDLCEIGDLVAIAAKPVSGKSGVNSKVFLWDKVSQDPSAVIDFGDGDIVLLDESEGDLLGIIQTSTGTSFAIRPKMVVRQWGGGSKATVAFELAADLGTSTLTISGNWTKVREGSRIIFGLAITLAGTAYKQLASIGRKSTAYPLSFTFDRLVDNDTALTGNINGVAKAGDYVWVAHNDDGSINRTNDQAVYTNATAVYISQKLNGESRVGDVARRLKRLLMAGLRTAPLTSGQSVSVYYRTDGNSSWTLIRTYAYGDDAAAGLVPVDVGFEAGSAGTSNVDFLNYKEFQFKVAITGGAEITGIPWAWQLSGAQISSE